MNIKMISKWVLGISGMLFCICHIVPDRLLIVLCGKTIPVPATVLSLVGIRLGQLCERPYYEIRNAKATNNQSQGSCESTQVEMMEKEGMRYLIVVNFLEFTSPLDNQIKVQTL